MMEYRPLLPSVGVAVQVRVVLSTVASIRAVVPLNRTSRSPAFRAVEMVPEMVGVGSLVRPPAATGP